MTARANIDQAGRNNLWRSGGPGYSSTSDNWATPPAVFSALNAEFGFTLDACASATNAKCRRYFDEKSDGLARSWAPATTWMNPPYGRAIGLWMKKAGDEAARGGTVVCLVPARTDTRWWHAQVMARASEVRFVVGRLKFGDARSAAPFPSAIVVYRPDAERLEVGVWQPPRPSAESRKAPASPARKPGPDDQSSMKSSRNPSVSACLTNVERAAESRLP